ncbi:hypothetical protein K438DRAFT_2141743 [Mycena galopus ATCC 62051]|nr:hypothetical protein K438DRAFT_2141743 [Mycena galopus ATCC 62051]
MHEEREISPKGSTGSAPVWGGTHKRVPQTRAAKFACAQQRQAEEQSQGVSPESLTCCGSIRDCTEALTSVEKVGMCAAAVQQACMSPKGALSRTAVPICAGVRRAFGGQRERTHSALCMNEPRQIYHHVRVEPRTGGEREPRSAAVPTLPSSMANSRSSPAPAPTPAPAPATTARLIRVRKELFHLLGLPQLPVQESWQQTHTLHLVTQRSESNSISEGEPQMLRARQATRRSALSESAIRTGQAPHPLGVVWTVEPGGSAIRPVQDEGGGVEGPVLGRKQSAEKEEEAGEKYLPTHGGRRGLAKERVGEVHTTRYTCFDVQGKKDVKRGRMGGGGLSETAVCRISTATTVAEDAGDRKSGGRCRTGTAPDTVGWSMFAGAAVSPRKKRTGRGLGAATAMCGAAARMCMYARTKPTFGRDGEGGG